MRLGSKATKRFVPSSLPCVRSQSATSPDSIATKTANTPKTSETKATAENAS